jgi:hypothetical protein
MKIEDTLELWHQFVADPRPDILDDLLADDVFFHSPFVWKPKEGKAAATAILLAAAETFEDFGYIRQLVAGNHLALEFEAHIGELMLRGMDLIEVGPDGKITDFEVMIRPANGLQALGMEMAKRLMLKTQELVSETQE